MLRWSRSKGGVTVKGETMTIEARISDLGLVLPEEAKLPPDFVLDFAWARVHGDRVYVSGHGAQAPDGSFPGPFGRVGAEVMSDEAETSARLATLAAIASLKRAIGSLDRVEAFLRLEGFVLAGPGFDRPSNIINVASHLIINIFGEEIGRHSRFAVGVAATPLSCPVIIAAQVAIRR